MLLSTRKYMCDSWRTQGRRLTECGVATRMNGAREEKVYNMFNCANLKICAWQSPYRSNFQMHTFTILLAFAVPV